MQPDQPLLGEPNIYAALVRPVPILYCEAVHTPKRLILRGRSSHREILVEVLQTIQHQSGQRVERAFAHRGQRLGMPARCRLPATVPGPATRPTATSLPLLIDRVVI